MDQDTQTVTIRLTKTEIEALRHAAKRLQVQADQYDTKGKFIKAILAALANPFIA